MAGLFLGIGAGPGIGLSTARRFAAEGFYALAPDLYRGDTTTQPSEAEQKMMALSMDQVVASTVLRMPAKPGPGSLEMETGEMETGETETGYPKAIGDALASRSHRTANAYTRLSR